MLFGCTFDLAVVVYFLLSSLSRLFFSMNEFIQSFILFIDWFVRKPPFSNPRFRMGIRTYRRSSTGTDCLLDWSRISQRNYFYEWCHRIQQFEHQGRRPFLQKTRKAHYHHTNRAQVCFGFLSFLGTRGIRCDLFASGTSHRTSEYG